MQLGEAGDVLEWFHNSPSCFSQPTASTPQKATVSRSHKLFNNDQLINTQLSPPASHTTLFLAHNSMPRPFIIPLSSSSSTPHMLMNIPYFSSLLDSSSSSSTNLSAPVIIPMNEYSRPTEELLAGPPRHDQLLQLERAPPPAMATGAHHEPLGEFMSPPAAASATTNAPAMLQFLSAALNGADHHHLINTSDAPATLNFFQHQLLGAAPHDFTTIAAGPLHQIDSASLEALNHNAHLLQGQDAFNSATSAAGFLTLFNKEASYFNLHDNVTTTFAPSLTNPFLQLQPLENQPSIGSPPTLFQKRAAQRRHIAASHPLNSFTSPGSSKPSPSSSSCSKAKLAAESPAQPLGFKGGGSPCTSIRSNPPAHLVKLPNYPSFHADWRQEACNSERGGATMEHVVQEFDGKAGFLDDQRGPVHLERFEDDEDCEALFHMNDPDLQVMEEVGEGILQETTTSGADDDQLLPSATADIASQLAGANNHYINDTTNKGGRGKGKGPPAKNLMAERRRRKKLNDRLYTLRSVVPKISKMDRASILGDAIEYLKELLQRINDLHNELEASALPATTASASCPLPPTPSSFTNQSNSLTPTSAANLSPFVKLEDCPSTSSQLQAIHDPTQPPKIEVRTREGRALNIHMFCARRPGLLLSTMRALDGLGLDVQQAVISCFNGFALDVFRAEQSHDEDVGAEEIKRVLLHTATASSS